MTTDTDTDKPVATPAQSAEVGRALSTIALALGTLGLAVPFGSSSGATSTTITPLEWAISILGMIAVVGLLLNFVHPWRSRLWRFGFAEMSVGLLWAASTVYEFLLPNAVATLQWRVGHALIYFGYAVLALTTWRWIVKGRTRQ